MNKPLYSQVAIRLFIGSLFFAFLLALFSFYQQRQFEINRLSSQISEFFHLEEKTAALAFFHQDLRLQKQFLNKFKRHTLISDAYFLDLTGQAKPQMPSNKWLLAFDLFAPDDSHKTIGKLHVVPNYQFIDNYAFFLAKNQFILLAFYAILLLVLSLFIMNQILILPLRKISHVLGQILPGELTALSIPNKNKKNEIGALAKDINSVLNEANQQIVHERGRRNETELLSKKFRLLFDKANVGIGLLNKKNHLIIANPTLLGLLTQSYLANTDKFQATEFTQHFQNPDQVTDFIENYRVKFGVQGCSIDTKLRHKAKTSHKWVHCLLSKIEDIQGTEEHLLEVVIYDITQRSQRELTIIYDAEHDMLTGLYNRRATLPKLEKLLAKAIHKQQNFAILMIDLDGFKAVNDTYGHDAGDKVIVEISRRVKQYFRGTDVVSRWGGDEFLIGFCYDPSYKSAVNDIASDLQLQISLPISIGREQTASVGSSIGISIFPKHGDSIHSLIEKSDMTMYRVKQQGKNGYAVYGLASNC